MMYPCSCHPALEASAAAPGLPTRALFATRGGILACFTAAHGAVARPGQSAARQFADTGGRRGAKLVGSYSAGDWLRPTWRAGLRGGSAVTASTPVFPYCRFLQR